MKHCPKQTARGFSLIEVLIALLILAIGMLALAASEIMGQRGTHDAQKRSHATMLANDLAERIHANPTGSYIKSFTRADCKTAVKNNNNIPKCSAALAANKNNITKCTPNEMAEYDLAIWFCGNGSYRGGALTLLGGPDITDGLTVTANITCPDQVVQKAENEGDPVPPPVCPLGSNYFISIGWQEREPNRQGNNVNFAHGTLVNKTLELAVVP